MHATRIVSIVAGLTSFPVLASGAQGPESFRTLASFTERLATDPHVSPDGRFILLGTRAELRVYNVASRRSVKLADGAAWDLAWSPKLDRIAWVRAGDAGKGQYVWTMPVDPKTALASGPAQRVSVGQGGHPAISPDGKWIAFSAPDSAGDSPVGFDQPHHLAIVPATGGPERVVARFDSGYEGQFWSADGASLFVTANPRGLPKAGIAKVYVDQRPPEVVRSVPGEWVAGMTPDGQHLIVVPARNPVAVGDSATVLDTDGRETGRAALPVGTIAEYDGGIDGALVWVGIRDRRHVEIHSIDKPGARRIVVGEEAYSPLWSPDGKRIAFQVRENGHSVLALMDADGSNVRVLRDAELRPAVVRWSPDSKSIGFASTDSHRFMILDVASRGVRTIADLQSRRIGGWIWREDGKSIAAFVSTRSSEPAPPDATIDDISLSGERHTLVQFPALGRVTGYQFLDGSTAIVRTDSAAFLFPLTGGTPRRLVEVPRDQRALGSAVSHDRKTIATPTIDNVRGESNLIELISLESGHRTVLELPFRFTSFVHAVFARDDRSLLVFGQHAGDTTGAKVYSVPLNGDTPRAIATLPSTAGAGLTVAPDGKSFAYGVNDGRTTSLLLVDLRAVLARGAARPGRRSPDHR